LGRVLEELGREICAAREKEKKQKEEPSSSGGNVEIAQRFPSAVERVENRWRGFPGLPRCVISTACRGDRVSLQLR
jgi:uncharacterized protein YmfQ (DUF2313 family)